MKYQKLIERIFIGFFVVIAIFLVIPVIPIKGNYLVKSVQSGSMTPKIRQGSAIMIIPKDTYEVDEIITYGKKSMPITHRIVEKREVDGEIIYITKGDANESPDMSEIYESNVIGKVVLDVPFLGFLIDFIKKPFGFLMIILIPAGIIIYDEVQKIRKALKN